MIEHVLIIFVLVSNFLEKSDVMIVGVISSNYPIITRSGQLVTILGKGNNVFSSHANREL